MLSALYGPFTWPDTEVWQSWSLVISTERSTRTLLRRENLLRVDFGYNGLDRPCVSLEPMIHIYKSFQGCYMVHHVGLVLELWLHSLLSPKGKACSWCLKQMAWDLPPIVCWAAVSFWSSWCCDLSASQILIDRGNGEMQMIFRFPWCELRTPKEVLERGESHTPINRFWS